MDPKTFFKKLKTNEKDDEFLKQVLPLIMIRNNESLQGGAFGDTLLDKKRILSVMITLFVLYFKYNQYLQLSAENLLAFMNYLAQTPIARFTLFLTPCSYEQNFEASSINLYDIFRGSPVGGFSCPKRLEHFYDLMFIFQTLTAMHITGQYTFMPYVLKFLGRFVDYADSPNHWLTLYIPSFFTSSFFIHFNMIYSFVYRELDICSEGGFRFESLGSYLLRHLKRLSFYDLVISTCERMRLLLDEDHTVEELRQEVKDDDDPIHKYNLAVYLSTGPNRLHYNLFDALDLFEQLGEYKDSGYRASQIKIYLRNFTPQ